MFMAVLCLTLSVLNFYNQRRVLYQRYQSEIDDILKYVDSHIDDEDLKHCIETKEESETYKKTLQFMDEIMEDFDIHYLYAVTPLNENDTGNMMSVLSAEDYYNRHVDTEGNLYLGWISDDEFDAKTAKMFFDIMKQDDIVYFVETTEWSTDYTGALPLKDADGNGYAVLCVDIDITTLYRELWSQVLRNAAVIVLLGALYTISFLSWTHRNITNPVMLLEAGVVAFAGKSHGQRSVEALHFEAPNIHTENEVESLSKAITQMTVDMQDYVSDILSAEQTSREMKQLADTMSELATMDSLTGVRNKTAFLHEVHRIDQALTEGVNMPFGIAMIDLNFLKVINDTYGHEKGDEAIKRLTRITCSVFEHSPVFRVGGDEFVVVLRGHDYQYIRQLKARFMSRVSQRLTRSPWRRVSAAIGVALYDPDTDANVDEVLRRADKAMYAQKVAMKATRKDADVDLDALAPEDDTSGDEDES